MKKLKENNIFPILLAGGIGSRLWPVSRKNYPKQFLKFFDKHMSFFQKTVLGFKEWPTLNINNPSIFTNIEYRFIVEEQISEINEDNLEIILEPSSKNTGPSILGAALHVLEKDIDGILVVVPTDHQIENRKDFVATVSKAVNSLERGALMTLGIKPDRPETGYGYMELSIKKSNNTTLISRFIEKPNISSAKRMFNSGNYLWNSGVFIGFASDIKSFFFDHSKVLYKHVSKAYQRKSRDLTFINLEKSNWDKCPSISFDYAIVEKLKKIQTTEFDGFWDDMGNWEAYWRQKSKNKNNTFTEGLVFESECENSLLISEGKNIPIVASGLKDITVVASDDAVLVSKHKSLTDINGFLSKFKDKKLYQGENFSLVFRPWGHYETLIKASKFHVKKILVKPRARLSLQSHKYRSEHWVVVNGIATVVLDDKEKTISENESIYVPLGTKHRLENKEDIPLIIIEVQTGGYLEEDDITRYEDDYKRV